LILSFDKVCQHLPQKTFDQQTKRTRYTGKQQPTRFFATEQNLHLIDPALCEPGQKKKTVPSAGVVCRATTQNDNIFSQRKHQQLPEPSTSGTTRQAVKSGSHKRVVHLLLS
jgi:hypothetical protein